jgi:hypothetical protein
MAQGQWFYTRDGQQAGPVSVDELRQMIASGQVAGQELAWKEGMANWAPASTIPELSAGAAASAAGGYPPPQYPHQHAAPQQYTQQFPAQQAPYPGQATPHYYQPTAPQSYNGMAVGSFVCSLVGLLCFGMVLGVVAIVLSIIAKNGMNRIGNHQGVVDIVLHTIWAFVFLSGSLGF